MHSTETRDFRQYLQSELIRRCEKNRQYSLRSFARDLRVHHGTLSRLLSGRRGLSAEMVEKLCESLGLNPKETEAFTSTPAPTNAKPKEYLELAYDTFVSMSEWYYDAILELAQTKNFKTNQKWIASRLGITVSEVNIAVERLQRLELITIESNKSWRVVGRNTSNDLDPNFSTVAMRKYQKRILEFSMDALESIPRSERDHLSNMMAMDPIHLPEIKKRFRDFRSELAQFVQSQPEAPTAVYQFAFSIFPISKQK